MTQLADAAPKRWYHGLRARVILMLSLAAFPIGMIAVFQTTRLAETADENAELALLALSDQAVQAERLLIQRAFGAANMLGNLAPYLLENPDECAPVLQGVIQTEPSFSFAGIMPLDGVMDCSSVEETLEFGNYEGFAERMQNPTANVEMNPVAQGSNAAVIIVSTPFEINGVFAGYTSVSIPQLKLAQQKALSDLPVSGLVELFTFNERGDVLTAEHSLESVDTLLPENFDVTRFPKFRAQSFRDFAQTGEKYIYTVVPVADSPTTIVGVWDPDATTEAGAMQSPIPASAFPIIMWIATVVVAVMALYSLVIKHIAVLRKQMNRFAVTRTVPETGLSSGAPAELLEIQERFVDLTDDILREEARLEAMVREQKVLAKEVHHRVKNNLQMIASIMNMQIRNAEQPETIETLQRVQDRIAALADVHKDLYSTQDEGRVNVGSLVDRTVQHSVEVGVPDVTEINLEKSIADVWMFPDQVVALSLLANEAITNAIKYMSAQPGEKPTLIVSLQQDGETCTLRVSNSTVGETAGRGTGIGSKLIRAFGIKLDAEQDVTHEAGLYTLQVRFAIAAFENESHDY
ncbi:sensor histidine kinase (plasmid) [Rhodobacteraceae bacterium S2214]|nr:sensor histidine kinase [Rhodobacteraceae bacterium S2214]